MTKPYRPSNGTEGMIFEDKYCDRCAKDAAYRETQEGDDACEIHNRAILGEDTPEWIEEDDFSNPRCTSFVLEGARPIKLCKGQLRIDGTAETQDRTVFGVKP